MKRDKFIKILLDMPCNLDIAIQTSEWKIIKDIKISDFTDDWNILLYYN